MKSFEETVELMCLASLEAARKHDPKAASMSKVHAEAAARVARKMVVDELKIASFIAEPMGDDCVCTQCLMRRDISKKILARIPADAPEEGGKAK